MHTIGHYGFVISIAIAAILLGIAALVSLWALAALAFAEEIIFTDGYTVTVVQKLDIKVNWCAPGAIAFTAASWALIAALFALL